MIDKELSSATAENALIGAEGTQPQPVEARHPTMTDAMLLLAEVEAYIDEWNFPITLGERVKAACDAWFGDVRPDFDDATGGDVWKRENL